MNSLLRDRCREDRFSAAGYNIRGSRRRAHDSVAWNTTPRTHTGRTSASAVTRGTMQRFDGSPLNFSHSNLGTACAVGTCTSISGPERAGLWTRERAESATDDAREAASDPAGRAAGPRATPRPTRDRTPDPRPHARVVSLKFAGEPWTTHTCVSVVLPTANRRAWVQ
eukprot:COSAG02_NODE_4957_length_4782_cov_2.868674_4_plen_168_part_00